MRNRSSSFFPYGIQRGQTTWIQRFFSLYTTSLFGHCEYQPECPGYVPDHRLAFFGWRDARRHNLISGVLPQGRYNHAVGPLDDSTNNRVPVDTSHEP